MKTKQQIAVKLSENDIVFLNGLGGKTKAIEVLIQEKRDEISGKTKKHNRSPFEQLYDNLYTPGVPYLNDLYLAIFKTYLRRKMRAGTMDYWMPPLRFLTGSNDETISKNIRKLASGGFIVGDGQLIRPTIRKNQDIKTDELSILLREAIDWVFKQSDYVDVHDELVTTLKREMSGWQDITDELLEEEE